MILTLGAHHLCLFFSMFLKDGSAYVNIGRTDNKKLVLPLGFLKMHVRL